jgi:hypothetical protein
VNYTSLAFRSSETRAAIGRVNMQENEATDPDQQLREWAESQGVWSTGNSAESRHGTGADALDSLRAEPTFSTDVEPACTERESIRPLEFSPHVPIQGGERVETHVSNAATFICLFGCLSIALGIARSVLAFFAGVYDSYTTLLCLSAMVSGLMVVGFGTIVENVARIEQHLRHRQ